jgi:hypothetical protein
LYDARLKYETDSAGCPLMADDGQVSVQSIITKVDSEGVEGVQGRVPGTIGLERVSEAEVSGKSSA